jgi:hypothetical protein
MWHRVMPPAGNVNAHPGVGVYLFFVSEDLLFLMHLLEFVDRFSFARNKRKWDELPYFFVSERKKADDTELSWVKVTLEDLMIRTQEWSAYGDMAAASVAVGFHEADEEIFNEYLLYIEQEGTLDGVAWTLRNGIREFYREVKRFYFPMANQKH